MEIGRREGECLRVREREREMCRERRTRGIEQQCRERMKGEEKRRQVHA